MNRARWIVPLVLAAAVAVAALAVGRGAAADDRPGKRLVYLFVSGKGPQAKAWYDGAPPNGVQVQTALDKFSADGYRYVAISSSGVATNVIGAAAAPTGADTPGADFVILMER